MVAMETHAHLEFIVALRFIAISQCRRNDAVLL